MEIQNKELHRIASTAIIYKDGKYLLDMAFIRPDNTPVVILSFYCPYKSGEVKLDEDSIDFAWVSYEEAKKYDIVEGLLQEIEMVEKILTGEDENNIQYGSASRFFK